MTGCVRGNIAMCFTATEISPVVSQEHSTVFHRQRYHWLCQGENSTVFHRHGDKNVSDASVLPTVREIEILLLFSLIGLSSKSHFYTFE